MNWSSSVALHGMYAANKLNWVELQSAICHGSSVNFISVISRNVQRVQFSSILLLCMCLKCATTKLVINEIIEPCSRLSTVRG